MIDMEVEAADETTSPANATAAPSEPEEAERCDGSDLLVKRKREDNDEQNQIDGSGIVGEGIGPGRDYLWKTSLCSFFRRSRAGVCRHGDACRYAHGEAELRPRPGNTWDPTSDRAKKLLKGNAGEVEKKKDAPVDLTILDKCLIGLPRKWASDKLKSFLDELASFSFCAICPDFEISYNTAKKKKGMTVGFVSFQNACQIETAMEVLKEKSSNGKQIEVADAVRRSQDKKHNVENSKNSISIEEHSCHASSIVIQDDFADTSIVEGIVSKTKNVRDVVTPLANMSYIDQLEYKKNSLIQTLKRLTRNARKACPDVVPLPEWVLKSREIGGLPCKLEGVLESPLIEGYRNKCEFSVGYSLEGEKTVGFMLGNFREGMTAVEQPDTCPNVSRISCKYAKIFQDFLLASEFPVWNRIDNSGFWRQFTVREGRSSGQVAPNESADVGIAEVMLIIQVCSLGFEEQMRNEFNRMAHALAHGAAISSPPLPLTAIVVQDHKGISNAASADCPLITLQIPKVGGCSVPEMVVATEPRIHDYICNLRFSISPTAFFQVNTFAAERLYNLSGEWAELSKDTLLFDICCGTGTIGLSLAHLVGMRPSGHQQAPTTPPLPLPPLLALWHATAVLFLASCASPSVLTTATPPPAGELARRRRRRLPAVGLLLLFASIFRWLIPLARAGEPTILVLMIRRVRLSQQFNASTSLSFPYTSVSSTCNICSPLAVTLYTGSFVCCGSLL
ncbi:Zinc finger CCCH domain-containing protein 24 [Apostasia shenzhenica]|uniref:Zinc finger CCCH domain-containing protein 24 n=1 Tax=Apostasia shenzhenica TaxID=1088818 RepID=A0A2I0AUN5_9ASPA|nr:Zinc finger CCCH domain-containing protein 24 [Apostasia shenzhenica]